MVKKIIISIVSVLFSVWTAGAAEQRTIRGAEWEAFLYGVETPQQKDLIRSLGQKKKVRLAVVSASGVNVQELQPWLDKNKSVLIYRNGSAETVRNGHDFRQLRSVLDLAGVLGVSLEIQIWQPDGKRGIAACFDAAGKNADVVLCYSSFWVRPLSETIVKAMEANPKALYIMPCGEVGKPSGDTPQAFARKFDGSGLPNLITAIPLAPESGGALYHPSSRDARDTQCVNFAVPAVNAHSTGETCPAAGSLTALACFAVAAADAEYNGAKIAELLFQSTGIPEQRMNRLSNFRNGGTEKFKAEIAELTKTDKLGFRRLCAPGLPDICKLCRLIVMAPPEPATAL